MTCISQETSENLKKGYDYGINLDTIDCNHFRMAHKILKQQGMSKFSALVDFPILECIARNKKCKNLAEFGVGEQDLKYFVYTIITFEKED